MSSPTKAPPTERERELLAELERAYGHLTDIASRLLLVNEAGEAALSTHDRIELSEKCLEFCGRGAETRRAALFLVEGDGLSIGATLGLAEDEVAMLPESSADVDACHAAIAEGRLQALDPTMLASPEVGGESELDTDPDEAAAEPVSENGAGDLEPEAEDVGAATEDEALEEEPLEAGDDEAEIDEEESSDAAEPASLHDPAPFAGQATFGVYLPVFLDGQAMAVLALGGRSAGRPYGQDEIVFLRHVLRQFAAALSRSTLIEQNERRLKELDALLEISRQTTSTLDLARCCARW